MSHVVVIGNGVAGTTLARHLRKNSECKITIISNETDYFYSRTALMYIYMGHMTFEDTQPYENWFWEKNRLELVRGEVTNIEIENKQVVLSNGNRVSFDKLVLALGSKPNKFGWPGQDLDSVQGLYHFQDLETMEKNTRGIDRAVVVGGGLIGIEMAEMLITRDIKVSFLVRESNFWNNVLPEEESTMISKHIGEHHVDLQLSTELKEILDDGTGKARAVITSKGEEIPCGFVGLTAGVHPNIALVKNATSPIETDRGILVDSFLQTNHPDIYAIGDCAQMRSPKPGRRPLEQVWYTGKIMGETLAQTLSGNKMEYDPGIWFNSAKFFDIEYQTYGTVLPNPGENVSSFVWQDQVDQQLIRINFDRESRKLIGINNFGIRLRHAVCEKWIAEEATVDHVLENFGAANFDPEFYKQREPEIIASFNASEFCKNPLSLKTSKGLFSNFFAQLR